MQGYDVFMGIILVAAIVWGAWKGLAWQIASLASLLLSYFVSLNFRQMVADQLVKMVEVRPPLDVFLSMLILFLGTSLVVWLGFNLISDAIERVKLKEFDRQIGALCGLAIGMLLCVIITLFVVALSSEPQRQAVCQSRSGYYIAVLLDKAEAVMPQEMKQLINPYVHELDERVVQPPPGQWLDNSSPALTERLGAGEPPAQYQENPGSQYAPDSQTAGRFRDDYQPLPPRSSQQR